MSSLLRSIRQYAIRLRSSLTCIIYLRLLPASAFFRFHVRPAGSFCAALIRFNLDHTPFPFRPRRSTPSFHLRDHTSFSRGSRVKTPLPSGDVSTVTESP
jgi:hypothetical protein